MKGKERVELEKGKKGEGKRQSQSGEKAKMERGEGKSKEGKR